MNILKLRLALGALLSLILFAVPAQAQQIVGINAAIKGKVETRKFDKKTLQPVRLKGRVNIGDHIRTNPAGVLQILLRDRTSFTIGKNGEMTIDRFVYDPANDASEVVATVTKGAFRFISGKSMRNRKGRSSIRTPVGSIGIRGTIFEGAVGDEALALARSYNLPDAILGVANSEATFVVLRGPGKGAQGNEKSGSVVIVTSQGAFSLENAGDAYFIPRKNARPFGPFFFGGSGFYWDQGWNFTGRPPGPRNQGRLAGNGRNSPRPVAGLRGLRPRSNGGPPPFGGIFEVSDIGSGQGGQGVP